MYKGQTIFLQLTDHLSRRTFRRLVKRYNANHRVRSFTCWEQFLAMAFAQLTYRESLRAGARGVRRRRAPPTRAHSIFPAARRGRSTVARCARPQSEGSEALADHLRARALHYKALRATDADAPGS